MGGVPFTHTLSPGEVGHSSAFKFLQFSPFPGLSFPICQIRSGDRAKLKPVRWWLGLCPFAFVLPCVSLSLGLFFPDTVYSQVCLYVFLIFLFFLDISCSLFLCYCECLMLSFPFLCLAMFLIVSLHLCFFISLFLYLFLFLSSLYVSIFLLSFTHTYISPTLSLLVFPHCLLGPSGLISISVLLSLYP